MQPRLPFHFPFSFPSDSLLFGGENRAGSHLFDSPALHQPFPQVLEAKGPYHAKNPKLNGQLGHHFGATINASLLEKCLAGRRCKPLRTVAAEY